jgi:hypothetical protein
MHQQFEFLNPYRGYLHLEKKFDSSGGGDAHSSYKKNNWELPNGIIKNISKKKNV